MQGSIWLQILVVTLVLANSAEACGPGCFRAGSQISTPDGRRSDPNSDSVGGLRVTGAANAIILDYSLFDVVK